MHLLCWFVQPMTAGCQGVEASTPEIYGLTLASSNKELLAYFSLKNGCPPMIYQVLATGVPVKYTFELELKVHRFLLDKTLARQRVVRILTFDNLKGEYRIGFGLNEPRVISVKTLEEAEKIGFEINDVPVIALSKLPAQRTNYVLRVRARVEKMESSLPFKGLMEIFSSWGLETRWYEIRFTY